MVERCTTVNSIREIDRLELSRKGQQASFAQMVPVEGEGKGRRFSGAYFSQVGLELSDRFLYANSKNWYSVQLTRPTRWWVIDDANCCMYCIGPSRA